VKWTKGPFAGLTGGMVFTATAGASGATSDLYLATTDGQLVRVGYVTSGGVVGQGDKTTPTASAQAVTMVFTDKEYGQDPQSDLYVAFAVDMPQLVYWDIQVQEAATLNLTVTGDNPAAAWTHTHTLTPGLKEPPVRVGNDAAGRRLSTSWSIATKSKTRFRMYLLTSVQGRSR
jgi:hypothetical protein